ncbi:MAG TPA: UPF0179 family protein [Methanoculleus sp.]|nr:UPF0179 family protein [Methanoculleus sp.]
MSQTKIKVTLIGTHLARPGLEFVYEGALPECRGCKVNKVCNNLQPSKRYQIVSVRNSTRHECRVHAGGACAVEVIESPVLALIPAEKAIVNSKILFEHGCNRESCKGYDLCCPEGAVQGEYYLVGEVLGNPPVECERGRALKMVELRPT